WAPRRQDAAWAMNAYGAVFVEVRVDPRFPMPRVTRALGVYSAGRIINPITARSQAIGGMIWGIGQALLEESRVDPNTGRFVAKGFGGYRVPTHADVGAVEALFVPEFDPHASPLGARGVGEIGTIGIGAAVANAVFNATGLRVRRLPVDLIGRRPSS
ncbi:MAG: xanthine dehydrogenase family protein molybdopterin-binding subunit, partial [Gemmatimonadales bacterium]|nr:xanthine dehydrogenase family protein molybdopterin-binding subunit [Gemmatimonadales bacterium]